MKGHFNAILDIFKPVLGVALGITLADIQIIASTGAFLVTGVYTMFKIKSEFFKDNETDKKP